MNNGVYYIDNVKLVKIGEEFLPEEGWLTEEDEDKVENWVLVWEENFDSINLISGLLRLEVLIGMEMECLIVGVTMNYSIIQIEMLT